MLTVKVEDRAAFNEDAGPTMHQRRSTALALGLPPPHTVSHEETMRMLELHVWTRPVNHKQSGGSCARWDDTQPAWAPLPAPSPHSQTSTVSGTLWSDVPPVLYARALPAKFHTLLIQLGTGLPDSTVKSVFTQPKLFKRTARQCVTNLTSVGFWWTFISGLPAIPVN